MVKPQEAETATNGRGLMVNEPAEVLKSYEPPAEPSINFILAQAIAKGMGAEALDKVVASYERLARVRASEDETRAAAAANAALARFQAECPPVRKTSQANITTKSGGSYSYRYAELDEIANTIRPFLHKNGLSYTWNSAEEVRADNRCRITCTCYVRHEQGHVYEAVFSCDTETSANLSGAQRSAAALTYARRQSLVQALGLTTGDSDNDAAPGDVSPISEAEAAALAKDLNEVATSDADADRFLKWMGVNSLRDIAKKDLQRALDAIENRRKLKEKK